jgi:hypothetical protein
MSEYDTAPSRPDFEKSKPLATHDCGREDGSHAEGCMTEPVKAQSLGAGSIGGEWETFTAADGFKSVRMKDGADVTPPLRNEAPDVPDLRA